MLTIAVKIFKSRAALCIYVGSVTGLRTTFSERFITDRNRENIYVIIYCKWEMGKVPKVARMAKEIRVVSENSGRDTVIRK